MNGVGAPDDDSTWRGRPADPFDKCEPFNTPGGLAPRWIRWGDTKMLGPTGPDGITPIGIPASETAVGPFGSQQIINAQYKMPTTWQLRVVFTFQVDAAQTGPIVVSYTLTHGVGSTQVSIVRTFTVNDTSAGVYPQLIDNDTLPGNFIAVLAAVVSITPTGPAFISCTAMVAPIVM